MPSRVILIESQLETNGIHREMDSLSTVFCFIKGTSILVVVPRGWNSLHTHDWFIPNTAQVWRLSNLVIEDNLKSPNTPIEPKPDKQTRSSEFFFSHYLCLRAKQTFQMLQIPFLHARDRATVVLILNCSLHFQCCTTDHHGLLVHILEVNTL